MKIKIYNHKTKEELQEFDLASAMRSSGKCTVGRSPTSGLLLESADVSRTHGEFSYQEGHYYFADTGSANGSLVNNTVAVKNQPYPLEAGQVLQLGEFILIPQPTAQVYEAMTVLSPIAIPLSDLEAYESAATTDEPSVKADSVASSHADSAHSLLEVEPEQHEPLLIVNEVELITPRNTEETDEPIELEAKEVAEPVQPEVKKVAAPETIAEPEAEEMAEPAAAQPTLETIAEPKAVHEPIAEPEVKEVPEPVTSQLPEVTTSEEEQKETIAEHEPTDAVIEHSVETETAQPDTPVDDLDVQEESTVVQLESEPETTLEQAKALDFPEPDRSQTIPEVESEPTIGGDRAVEEPETDDPTVAQADEATAEEPIPEDEIEDVAEPTILQTLDEPKIVAEPLSEESDTAVGINPNHYLPPELLSIDSALDSAMSATHNSGETAASDQDSINDHPPVSNIPEILRQKHIALLAHESQKTALVEFIDRHHAIFSNCRLMAPSSLSQVLQEQTGIDIEQSLPNLNTGGYQKVSAAVVSGELLAVVFLRDFITPQPSQANDEALSRACNVNSVIFAANVATADAVGSYLQHLINSATSAELAEV